MNKLYEEYWKEQEIKRPNKMFKEGKLFYLFNKDIVPVIKEMMFWAYQKGEGK